MFFLYFEVYMSNGYDNTFLDKKSDGHFQVFKLPGRAIIVCGMRSNILFLLFSHVLKVV